MEPVRLLVEHAVLLSDRKTPLVSDLHFGKAEACRSPGVPMPEGMAEESLEGRERAIHHGEEGMEEPLVERFER